jgi:hypothetical protein
MVRWFGVFPALRHTLLGGKIDTIYDVPGKLDKAGAEAVAEKTARPGSARSWA